MEATEEFFGVRNSLASTQQELLDVIDQCCNENKAMSQLGVSNQFLINLLSRSAYLLQEFNNPNDLLQLGKQVDSLNVKSSLFWHFYWKRAIQILTDEKFQNQKTQENTTLSFNMLSFF